ncbi:conserved hypothetical protein [Leishmania braziliensis MHOM/BR/75/M2904]|uniref:Uncharacterized protein n=1 Tax=Leishmania braziliensis TaxID=5660 RepID=A4HEZ4_LEIBR|nr:conserved hypothetical protein [Leishmania braziliensis MHOM/BR/75/M2904]CAM39403.1 conserved hypothetical protein [Leishmania braziliensis MHOM/BR/75/M2904]
MVQQLLSRVHSSWNALSATTSDNASPFLHPFFPSPPPLLLSSSSLFFEWTSLLQNRVTHSPTTMRRPSLSLQVSWHHRSYGCSTAAGAGDDKLRRCARPVSSAQTSGVVFRMGINPPSEVLRTRVISSPSPLFAQWQQRRHVCDVVTASALRLHNAAAGEAITDSRLTGNLSTAPLGPPTVCPPSSSTANTSGLTPDTSEASLVIQLQMLTKKYRGKPNSHSSKAVVDSRTTGADVPVLAKSAGALTDLLSDAAVGVSGSGDDRALTLSHNSEPAWQRGLELVQTASCATAEVMEWLLFLCLRSTQAAAEAADSLAGAPLEVCEGVYGAWRELHRGQKLESDATAVVDNTVAAAASAHELQPSSLLTSDPSSSARVQPQRHRSPFSPKGVHHHYATYLLRDLHHAQTAAASYKTTHKGSSGTNGDVDDDKVSTPTKDLDATQTTLMHHAHYLVHRVLEVLLVHLPQDEAVAAAAGPATKAAEQPYGVEGVLSRHRQASLRPTTALLVMEAVRHAAQLHRQSSALYSVGSSDNFPLLSYLWEAAHNRSLSQDAPAMPPSLTNSALAAVARETFETIMRSSATAPTHTLAGTSQQKQHHRLQDDALALYVAFLATICMPAMPQSRLEIELQAIECFVLARSPTARQFSVPSQQQQHQEQALSNGPPRSLIGADRTTHDQCGSASSASALAAAAGMRWLLATYLSPSSSAPVSGPRAEAAHSQWDLTRDTVVTALCRSNSLLTPSSCEPSSATHASDQDARVTPLRTPPTPLPWCAWMLQVLIHDDALRQQQEQGSGTASLGGLIRSDADEMSTLALSIQLVMELRRHSQATLARHGRPWLKEHRLLQLVWATLLGATVRGELLPTNSCRAAADSGCTTLHSARTRVRPHCGTPAVLQRLCYPHYDKTQWRRRSVNLYLQLLDQWGESTQVRLVFATVARRERDWQLEVHKAVLAERRGLVRVGNAVEGCGEDDSTSIGDSRVKKGNMVESQTAASTATEDPHKTLLVRVFRRYRPALNLESCLITLRHCGVPRRTLAELWDGPAGAKDDNEDSVGAPVAAAEIKLAGEVLQYMICSLHVMVHHCAPSGGNADANDEQRDWADDTKMPRTSRAAGDPGANLESRTIEADGLPVSHWVEWIRKSCVPALAHLYQSAGLEDAWEQLRHGRL